MKKLTALVIGITIITTSVSAFAKDTKRWNIAKYEPVAEFLGPDATLSKWYRQYKDTTAGQLTFNDFLKRLSASEVLLQRSKLSAGLTHNQLYSPIVTLLEKDWKALDKMPKTEIATIRISILELDIALAAIDATLPKTAHEEFRREVLRGAKPLTEVAKLPTPEVKAMPATQAMAFTIADHKLMNRINKDPLIKKPIKDNSQFIDPLLPSSYYLW